MRGEAEYGSGVDLRIFVEPQQGAGYDQLGTMVAAAMFRLPGPVPDINDLDHVRLIAAEVLPHV
jgi:hypothetical protein